MLEYKNSKTGSLWHMPGDIRINEMDDYSHLIKLMIYNDNRIIKKKMQELANCLVQVKEKRRLGE